jgi:hypothetical protein
MILCNFSLTQATAGIPLVFTIGGACNAAAILMGMAGASCFYLPKTQLSPSFQVSK